ncbi:hypothetical protein HK096_009404, partial [Nowakowskiella sp. JEL0078]
MNWVKILKITRQKNVSFCTSHVTTPTLSYSVLPKSTLNISTNPFNLNDINNLDFDFGNSKDKTERDGKLAVDKYAVLVNQCVNHIMRNGEKAKAQRFLSEALQYIQQTKGVEPLPVLADAVNKAAPLVKIVSQRQGAKNVMIPTPLLPRQQIRTAIKWIVEATKKPGTRDTFGVRLGKELLAVLEGDGSVIKKRMQVHKLALANRSNVTLRDTP